MGCYRFVKGNVLPRKSTVLYIFVSMGELIDEFSNPQFGNLFSPFARIGEQTQQGWAKPSCNPAVFPWTVKYKKSIRRAYEN